MVWYSHLFQNFPQFIVIHTVKGFGIVNEEEIDVFLELSCFFDDPADVGNLVSGSFAFSTHGHHQMVNTEIRLIIFAAKDGEALYSQQKQDQEVTVAQIMNSLLPNSDLKKVGKTTRPFRYDLNQIPYDYTVEVRNRFKGLDLIECLMNYGMMFVTLYRRRIKTIPKEKKCKKAEWLSGEALQIAVKRREVKSKGEKERYTHLSAEF